MGSTIDAVKRDGDKRKPIVFVLMDITLIIDDDR